MSEGGMFWQVLVHKQNRKAKERKRESKEGRARLEKTIKVVTLTGSGKVFHWELMMR